MSQRMLHRTFTAVWSRAVSVLTAIAAVLLAAQPPASGELRAGAAQILNPQGVEHRPLLDPGVFENGIDVGALTAKAHHHDAGKIWVPEETGQCPLK